MSHTQEFSSVHLPSKEARESVEVSFIRIALWFGLLTTLGELLIVGGERFFLNHFLDVNPHVFWMMPFSNLLVFGFIGTLFAFFLGSSTSFWKRWILMFAICFLFSSALLLRFQPALSRLAAVLLAAGLATQMAHQLLRHSSGFSAWVRHTTVPLTLIACLQVVSAYAWATWREDTPSTSQAKPSSAAPNVLIVVLDTVRAQNLSLYGYHRRTTPNLDRLATTGVVFERAFATAPWTLPTHGTLFTGCWPHQLFPEGATPLNARTPLLDSVRYLPEFFQDAGYRTGGFVGNLVYTRREYGLSRGFLHYEDYKPTFDTFWDSCALTSTIYRKHLDRSCGCASNVGRKNAAEVNREFLRWVDAGSARPFFAFLNYFDAHDPYVPPEAYTSLFEEPRPSHPQINPYHSYSLGERAQMQAAYDRCLVYMDEQLGYLIRELEQRGLRDNTFILITSDHGEHFGEHGLMSHGNSLYRPVLEVPLVFIYPPQVPANRRIRETVSLRDIPITLLEMAKLEDAGLVPGVSLTPLWTEGQAAKRSPVYSELIVHERMEWWPPKWPVSQGTMRSLILDGYHYICNGDGKEELYDLEQGPAEMNNLVDTPLGKTLLPRFREKLAEITNSSSSS